MSREELERFLTAEGRAAVDRLFSEDERESDDFDVNEVLDQNLYEALSEFDKSAALSRWLSLRFTGPHAEGRIAEQALEDILSAFRREISGANNGKDINQLKLDLVGFSRGSAILHLIPAVTDETGSSIDQTANEQQRFPVREDQLDDALGVVTELHAAAEQEGDVQRFSGKESLLKGFTALTAALDKYELDMGIIWRNSTGRRRSAELTSHGRQYARQYFERSDTSEIITINGRVVELKISGSFDVKASPAANSPRYTINTSGEENLLGLHLELGQMVSVRVRRHTERNKVGVVFGSRYEFLDMVTYGEPLA